MGNFETAIPKNIATLEKELANKRWTIHDINRQYTHDCDCEYCTEPQTAEVPADIQPQIDELEAEIADIIVLINRLKRHAKANGVELE